MLENNISEILKTGESVCISGDANASGILKERMINAGIKSKVITCSTKADVEAVVAGKKRSNIAALTDEAVKYGHLFQHRIILINGKPQGIISKK